MRTPISPWPRPLKMLRSFVSISLAFCLSCTGISSLNYQSNSNVHCLKRPSSCRKTLHFLPYFHHFLPRAGSGAVRTDPLCFLAGCRTRRLNQVQFVLYLSIHYMVALFIMAPFYVLLVFIAMCSVFWLFWLSYQYLPSDWLERLVCIPILLCFLGQLSHLPYIFLALV